MGEYIKNTSVQEVAKRENLRVSKKVFSVIDDKIEELLYDAIDRVRHNKRKTIQEYDI